ncbi:hypothetical protein [Paraflavitalea sp. CAU 1676]|uniref:hypothetical protein n=1 Tax=Paraflavitalea sp. CAU 1676 TaxID=3032598 RepID=UPI0023DC8D54|nr:hypothetical protein [Paraflavitalea sp. CAU 1676]MDF2190946.1 hypothetical protein [Paraflavitalea sp. CAU 1676]
MKFLSIACMTVFLMLAACQDNADKKAPQQDAKQEDSVVESLDTLLSAETIQSFSTSGISEYVRKRSASFDWNKFRMVSSYQEDSMLVTPFEDNNNFFRNYGPFLKYSPDSSMFIDLDSYNIDITRDAQGRFSGSEMGPDTEVSLIDVEDKTRTRLVFLGPGGMVEDGLWLDNQTLVLMGRQENEHGKQVPTLWRFHVPTHTYFIYELPDPSLAGPMAEYWKTERLKLVKIK